MGWQFPYVSTNGTEFPFDFGLALTPEQARARRRCGCSEGAPTPIRHVDHEFFDRSRTPVADSLGTVVTWWIDALDRGAWTYDRGRGYWEEIPERLADPGLASTGLV
jgi:hypothetical protein